MQVDDKAFAEYSRKNGSLSLEQLKDRVEQMEQQLKGKDGVVDEDKKEFARLEVWDEGWNLHSFLHHVLNILCTTTGREPLPQGREPLPVQPDNMLG